MFAPYAHDLPAGADEFALPGDDDQRLTPIDNGNVCVNVDDTWFAEQGLAPPTSLDDLTDPAYRDLFVLPGATTSSTGLAFLLATVAAYGDGWSDYWTRLMANGAQLTAGWSDAYYVDFTQGGGIGRPPDRAVLRLVAGLHRRQRCGSIDTSALLDTCFQQVEYAGVLAGAENPDGAEELVSLPADPRGAGRAARRACTSSRSSGDRPAGRLGDVRRAADATRTRWTRPRSPRAGTSGCASGVTSPPVMRR